MEMKHSSYRLNLLVSIAILAIMPSIVEGAIWYDTDWQMAKKITVNATEVIGVFHTDFPLLVELTDTDLIGLPGGCDTFFRCFPTDFLFTNINNNTRLDFEIQWYNSTSGFLTAHVRIPFLQGTTEIMMYYNDTGSNGDQSNPTGVWSSEYLGVYHLVQQGTSPFDEMFDSTSNSLTLQRQGSSLFGGECQIGVGCQSFDSINDRIRAPDITNFAFDYETDPYTISAWVITNTGAAGNDMVIATRDGINPGQEGYAIMYRHGVPRMETEWSSVSGTEQSVNAATLVWQSDVWQYLISSSSGSGDRSGLKMTLNGTLHESGLALAIPGGLDWSNSPGNFTIGAETDNQNLWLGVITEVRIRSDQVSEDWMETEYNSQRVNSTFLSFSSESSAPDGILDTIILGLNPPTATTFGGVFAKTCLAGQVLTGIDIFGNPICEYNYFMQTSGTSHAFNPATPYWAFGINTDAGTTASRRASVSMDYTVTGIGLNCQNCHNMNNDARWYLMKNEVRTSMFITMENASSSFVGYFNHTGSVSYLAGDTIAFEYDPQSNTVSPANRGFSIRAHSD